MYLFYLRPVLLFLSAYGWNLQARFASPCSETAKLALLKKILIYATCDVHGAGVK